VAVVDTLLELAAAVVAADMELEELQIRAAVAADLEEAQQFQAVQVSLFFN
jgi:hypothetical protein